MTIPLQQKALVLPAVQADFVLETIDVPKPRAGEVLVRVEAAGLNPLEWKLREKDLGFVKYPVILGAETAGVIVEVGPDVTGRVVGDVVAWQPSLGKRTAGYQQYSIAKAHLTVKVPSNLSLDQAVTFPAGLVTAAHALYTGPEPSIGRGGANLTPFWRDEGRKKYAGQPIVIFGGASANGQFAIQLARLSGFSPIITTASISNKQLLTGLGATHLIDRRLDATDTIAKVREIVSEPIRLVYDSIALVETQNIAYDLVHPDGTILLALQPAVDEAKQASVKKTHYIGGMVGLPPYEALDTELFDILPTYLASGDIKMLIPEYIPGGLTGVPAGLERLKRNEVSARKLVIHPQETV